MSPVEDGAVVVVPLSPATREARALVAELDDDLAARYPGAVIHALHPGDTTATDFVFLVARVDGTPVGCGALRRLAPGIGEVKRMFVRPPWRGRGVARALLAALEASGRARGDRMLRLETGTRQPEAIGLYRAAGYVEIPPFGEYAGNPFSRCFEKALAEGAPPAPVS